MFKQYKIEGYLTYLLQCPKAPEVALCDKEAGCPGHEYHVDIFLYVLAPDPDRAILQAYGKLKGAYPWPLFADSPPLVEVCERPTTRIALSAKGPMLPGFGEYDELTPA